MASVNKVILIGNLTRDPETRHTPKGSAVTELGLAMNRKYKVDEETKEEVTFVDVAFWGASGETIAKYLSKGNPIYIEGRLQLDTWEDKQSGQKRSKIRVIGERFQFLGGGGGESNAQPRPAQQAAAPSPQPAPKADSLPLDDNEDDDVPF